MITYKKYNFLSKLATTLSDLDRKEIKEFEDGNRHKPTKKALEYFQKMNKKSLNREYIINYNMLLNAFLLKFKEVKYVDFDKNEGRLENVKCILQYFSKHNEFLTSDNLCRNEGGEFISQPSFDKGLLIIGGYGCGKSSTMEVLKELFNNTPLSFKSFTTNKIVTTFESYSDPEARTYFINKCKTKDAYFDDIKTEKDASNYGIHNLMRGIIEERSRIKCKTYLTCNHLENDSEMLISNALYEFNTRYGARVFDRLFEMYNIIEFKGSSMRK